MNVKLMSIQMMKMGMVDPQDIRQDLEGKIFFSLQWKGEAKARIYVVSYIRFEVLIKCYVM